MRRIMRILSIVILLIVLLVGVEFFAVNSDPVTINYFLGSVEWSLSLVVVVAFSMGVLVTILFSITFLMPLRWRVNQLRQTVSNQEQQINVLRKKPDREIRQT
jgi:putative membrane protein